MRNTYSRRSSGFNIPWIWIGILALIIVGIFLLKGWTSPSKVNNKDTPYITVSPSNSRSIVNILMSESSKRTLSGTGGQPLYVGDTGVSVDTAGPGVGGATMSNGSMTIDADDRSELSYLSRSGGVDTLHLTKGRLWIKQISDHSIIEMKNAKVLLDAGDTVMLEQQSNQINSTIYAIQGTADIETSVGKQPLGAGNRIIISTSDLANPNLNLKGQIDNIDEDITQLDLFIRNDGKELLSNIKNNSTSTNTGGIQSNGTGTQTASGKFIEILDPKDGAVAQKSKISIQGNLVSKDVKRVTFNDKDASVSPVNSTFVFPDFEITGEVNNVVYKVYDPSNTLLEKGVITIYGSKQALQNSTTRLVPDNSPISSKDFKIISPGTNPYKTTETFVKVQGSVPKDRVSYIVVNGYRLQKYVAGSTTWYYFANTETETLKEGINSYTIKFYGPNDTLLYTQLFSIIKEAKNATPPSDIQ